MKLRPGLLCTVALFCCVAAVVPAAAQQDVYDNGPVNGEVDAFTINFGFVVSNTFAISGGNQSVNGLSFGAWLIPGDVLQTVDVTLSSQSLGGGTVFFDGTVNFTPSNCFANTFGFDVCTESGSFNDVLLNSGSYWLTLQNAVVSSGDPIYWDQNDGVGCTSPGCPSQAQSGSVGTIPSESFTLTQTETGTTSATSTTSTTPEPSTLMLLGSGALAAIGALRRKLA
jgi:hypothetical protein